VSDGAELLANIKQVEDGRWTAMQIYADWLEEHGETNLGYAYRWAGIHKRYPGMTPKLKYVFWLYPLKHHGEPKLLCYLPKQVWLALPRRKRLSNKKWNCRIKTVEDAFAYLAEAIDHLRKTVSLEKWETE
jgi:hypothetical protein